MNTLECRKAIMVDVQLKEKFLFIKSQGIILLNLKFKLNIYCHGGQNPEKSLCFRFQQSRKQVQRIYQYELFAILSYHAAAVCNVEDFPVFRSSFLKLFQIAFCFFS